MMKRTQLYLDEDVYLALEDLARREGRTVSSYIRGALRKQISQGREGWKKALRALKKMAGFSVHGPRDLAKNYEKYLYDR